MSKAKETREQNYQLLKEYFIQNKHLKPPVNSDLYKIISYLRQSIKKGNVPTEYIDRLKRIGFILDQREEAWRLNIKSLKEYIDKYGAEAVYSTTCPKEIYNFHKHRREDYQKNKLTEKQRVEFLNTGAKLEKKILPDISGEKHGHLLVVKKTKKSDLSGALYYKCLCVCGATTLATKFSLESGKKKTCGACEYSKSRYILSDYIGKTIGKLTVLDVKEKKIDGTRFWTTKCICGNIKEISVTNLLVNQHCYTGEINCGCINKQTKKRVTENMQKNSYKNKDRSLVAQTKKIKNNNKSGYIGVHLVSARVTKQGSYLESFYQSKLKHDNQTVVIGKYGNDKKSLLQGAIDRDLYIIENDLKHTRNFTDKELLEKIFLFESDRKDCILQKSREDFEKILKNKED